MKQPYFEGWYIKAQNQTDTIAIIPAYHRRADGTEAASIQVITKEASYYVPYDASTYACEADRLSVWIGSNHFHQWYAQIMIKTEQLTATGKLFFSNNRDAYRTYGDAFLRPNYPVMGPFACFKNLPCYHSVISLNHRVDGAITINGKDYVFDHGTGYIESDRGHSFPNSYVWTQCSITKPQHCIIMASIADLTVAGISMIGCIAIISYQGREYRLATYLGAKLLYLNKKKIIIRQNRYRLIIQVLHTNEQKLTAPVKGHMSRSIHESVTSRVRYQFYHGSHQIFDLTSEQAGFEYCINRKNNK